ncbi:MAG: FadR/GntR family transcriptional regulator [Pseudomonadota bacterium]
MSTATPRRRAAPKGRAQSLYETLRDRIIAGEFPPGTRLPAERELVELYGVNRGAVREALNRLAQAKMVATVHGGGTRVEPYLSTSGLDLLLNLVSTADGRHRRDAVRSLIEMRTALAVDAARLAALRHTEAQLTALRLQARELPAATDDAALQGRLLAIWATIVDASGNIAYKLAFNTLRDGYVLFGKVMHRVSRDSFHAPDYRVLIDAIAQHDAMRAERGARRIVDKDAALFIERFGL